MVNQWKKRASCILLYYYKKPNSNKHTVLTCHINSKIFDKTDMLWLKAFINITPSSSWQSHSDTPAVSGCFFLVYCFYTIFTCSIMTDVTVYDEMSQSCWQSLGQPVTIPARLLKHPHHHYYHRWMWPLPWIAPTLIRALISHGGALRSVEPTFFSLLLFSSQQGLIQEWSFEILGLVWLLSSYHQSREVQSIFSVISTTSQAN